MPRAVGSEAGNWGLAYWVGQRLRGGVDALAGEVVFLQGRVRGATPAERLSWLWRCGVAIALLAAEIAVLTISNSKAGSPLAFVTSWLALILMPRPVPRLLLVTGRLLAAILTAASIASLISWATSEYSGLRPWSSVLTLVNVAMWLGMTIWALAGFRRPSLRSTTSATSAAEFAASVPVDAELNVPRINFSSVGGDDLAKREIRLAAANRFSADKAQVVRNGVLLYGPQGTGKNLLAEATAGEFGVNFYHVRCPELLSVGVGSTAGEIRRVFESAAQHRPAVLFLDEIDAIGSRKQPQAIGTDAGGGGREYNAVTTQLMQSIDRYRSLDGLLIMAATNSLDGLEPTLIRDGRFDLKLRLDLPNQAEREDILTSMLKTGAHAAPAIAEISRRTPGWSPARLRALIDRAILQAGGRPVTDEDILAALEESGGTDRPQVEAVNWDDVVLPGPVASDIRAILRLLVPGTAEQLGVPAPTGLVLVGQPGTGKTLVARLIASQAKRSFYAITPSDVLSGAVGGSVKRLAEVFARAREHAPSILFFDEMDALFPAVTGYGSQHDIQLVEQALIEISELRPEHQVFLIGTTNDLSRIDPRTLRGGRFSEKIEIGLPDEKGYHRLLEMNLGPTQLALDLTIPRLVEMVRGLSPAEITAVVTAAKRFALARTPEQATALLPIEESDVEQAIARIR
jgi:transitional endoplasmic reticulum ATPase